MLTSAFKGQNITSYIKKRKLLSTLTILTLLISPVIYVGNFSLLPYFSIFNNEMGLSITATGEKAPDGLGSEIWLTTIKRSDGSTIPWTEFTMERGWEIRNTVVISYYDQPNTITWKSSKAEPISLCIASHPYSGGVKVRTNDGREWILQQYSKDQKECTKIEIAPYYPTLLRLCSSVFISLILACIILFLTRPSSRTNNSDPWEANLDFKTLSLILFLGFTTLFAFDLSPYWFNPEWTTDDSLQQVYPYHKVEYPDLFKNDLITNAMEGILTPLHNCIAYLFTVITKDPLMMAHCLMLIQIVTCMTFVFLSVSLKSSWPVALFSCTWLLHTRSTIQRLTCGLPRGWSAVVIAAFLYFLLKRQHKFILLILLLGCLLHPPTTLTCALAYGLSLCLDLFIFRNNKIGFEKALNNFIAFICISPLCVLAVSFIVERPAEIGPMIDYTTASSMPAMSFPNGRFPLVPLRPIIEELHYNAFQPLLNDLHYPSKLLEFAMPILGITIVIVTSVFQYKKDEKKLPIELLILLVGIILTYSFSRILAFKLYVPDRHLQIPMSIFWVVALPIIFHNYFRQKKNNLYYNFSFIILAILIYFSTGTGLEGSATFNYSKTQHGGVFNWIKKNTAVDSLIAGHPTHIDAMQLFGKRQAYATTETTHPFYLNYYKEIERRLKISFRAHYAKDLQEVVDLLEPEGIDYFVFSKKRFYPQALASERYFEPLNNFVRELCSRHYSEYAYKLLPEKVNLKRHPFLLFKDDQSAIIDIKKLKEFLKTRIK